MGVMINELVGANANTNATTNTNADANANDWVTTLALLDFVRRAKNEIKTYALHVFLS